MRNTIFRQYNTDHPMGIVERIKNRKRETLNQKIERYSQFILCNWLFILIFFIVLLMWVYDTLANFLYVPFIALLIFTVIISFICSCGLTSLDLFDNQQKNDILKVLIITFILLLTPFCTNLLTNGNSIYSNYPAYVNIYVEDSLPVEQVTMLTLLSLEVINQTFDYQLNLNKVISFEDDNKDIYTVTTPLFYYERAKLRYEGLIEKEIYISIYFYNGTAETKYGNGIVLGASNTGDKIDMYINKSKTIFSLGDLNGTFKNAKTLLHEFSHSFGLYHNPNSPIMHTYEKLFNLANQSKPDLNILVNKTNPHIIGSYDANDTASEIFHNFLLPKIALPLWSNYTYKISLNPNLTYYDFFFINRTTNQVLMVQLIEHHIGDGESGFSTDCYSFNIKDFTKGWLSHELARC